MNFSIKTLFLVLVGVSTLTTQAADKKTEVSTQKSAASQDLMPAAPPEAVKTAAAVDDQYAHLQPITRFVKRNYAKVGSSIGVVMALGLLRKYQAMTRAGIAFDLATQGLRGAGAYKILQALNNQPGMTQRGLKGLVAGMSRAEQLLTGYAQSLYRHDDVGKTAAAILALLVVAAGGKRLAGYAVNGLGLVGAYALIQRFGLVEQAQRLMNR